MDGPNNAQRRTQDGSTVHSRQKPLRPIPLGEIPPHDLTEYLDLFKSIDRDASGGIETVELVYAFNSMGVEAS